MTRDKDKAVCCDFFLLPFDSFDLIADVSLATFDPNALVGETPCNLPEHGGQCELGGF